jgi:MinD superfamily P-loop ATPase
MAVEAFTGETYRVIAEADLVGAAVTITIYDPAGVVVGTPLVDTIDTVDWSVYLTLPATAGQYEVKVVTTLGQEIGKDKFYVTMRPF